MWCATSQHKHLWDLSIYIDTDISMRTYGKWTVSQFFYDLAVAADSQTGITSHVPDTGGCFRSAVTGLPQWLLVGLHTSLVHRLQLVLNVSARKIFQLRRSDHITEALVSVHWLHVRIKLCVVNSVFLHTTCCVLLTVCSSILHAVCC